MGRLSGEVQCPLLEKLSKLIIESGDMSLSSFQSSALPCGDLTCPCRIGKS